MTSCLVSSNKAPSKTGSCLNENNSLPFFPLLRVNSFSGGRQNSFERVTHQNKKYPFPLMRRRIRLKNISLTLTYLRAKGGFWFCVNPYNVNLNWKFFVRVVWDTFQRKWGLAFLWKKKKKKKKKKNSKKIEYCPPQFLLSGLRVNVLVFYVSSIWYNVSVCLNQYNN